MGITFNIYCDESCHLQNDHQQVMVLGAIWCPLEKTREIAVRLREIKLIRWPRAIITTHDTKFVKCWKNSRKGEERVAIALEDFSYVVILADRGDYVLLWTAYWVEQEHRRQKLRREYEEYMRQNG